MFQVLALRQSEWNIQNSVDNTKLPSYTLPLTQHHSFFRNSFPLFLATTQTKTKTLTHAYS